MGCKASKFKRAEDVTRCKARKRLMKQTVASRHQFAAAHAAYIQAMKNVGAAFRQFGETETRNLQEVSKSSPDRPLPPPPPPAFLSPPRKHEQEFMSPPRKHEQEYVSPIEETNDGFNEKHEEKEVTEGFYYSRDEDEKKFYYSAPPPPPAPSTTAPPPPSPPRTSAWDFLDPFRPPEPPVHLQEQRRMKKLEMMKQEHEEAIGAAEDESSDNDDVDEDNGLTRYVPEKVEPMKSVGSSKRSDLAIIVMPSGGIGRKELAEVVKEVDELFLRAYECGKEVSKLLEARKVHYHSNFVDSKGYESHSKRVLHAISLGHRGNSKSPMALKVVASEDHLSSPEGETNTSSHAATLDRLLAWEKKLYEEVKTTEKIRLEYKKKCGSVRNDTKEELSDSMKVIIKTLSTKITVSLQGVDTAVNAINKLKEEELHPQLIQLIEGLMNMWHELYDCHQRQHRTVVEMKALDHWGSAEPTTNIHHLATSQLEVALRNWSVAFNKLLSSQRDYLHNLTAWLRLSNMQLEMEAFSKEKSGRSWTSSVLQLCHDWSLALDRLPDQVAAESIKSFEAVVHTLLQLQNEETKHRKKTDALSKELDKKYTSGKKHTSPPIENTHTQEEENHIVTVAEQEEDIPSILREVGNKKKVKVKRVDVLRERVEEGKEKVAKAVFDTRAMTVNSLHTGLPSIFQAVSGFGRICLHAYQSLYCQAHNGALLRITE